MTADLPIAKYWGVFCLHCTRPIPVDTAHWNPDASQPASLEHRGFGPFKAGLIRSRCTLCGKESVHVTQQLVRYDGHARSASKDFPPQSSY